MNIPEIVAYIAIGYFIVIPVLLYFLSRSTSAIEENYDAGEIDKTEEKEEYLKAA